jgi:aspartyl aminopeptidase
MQNLATFNQGLLDFLHSSPTPFHAVKSMVQLLQDAGFEPLDESASWKLAPYGRYYVIRNGSSLVAFTLGKEPVLETGFRMVGAHTDSPCLKVKPQPELQRNGYFQLGVEVYGGALLNPWYDRDLSLAGKVTFRDTEGHVKSALVDYQKPMATIPSLAIHLDREANKNRSINPQKDVPPILMQVEGDEKIDFRHLLLKQLGEQYPDCAADQVLDYELSFYDTQAPSLVGLNDEFIASARLDNLLSCYVGLQSLLEAGDQNCLLVCNDHEEVGSQSAAGAQGPLLKSVLERVVADNEDLTRVIDRSMLISADNAHGIHPNYADKHDGNHGPLLNAGPVIKINANQRYATNSETSALFRDWCRQVEVPVQAFVVRTDMGCGSTIGPLTAGELGVKTIDIGVPTFGMHSIRELAGNQDAYYLYQVLAVFNQVSSVSVSSV